VAQATQFAVKLVASPTAIALVLGNLLPIVGVVLWDWDVGSIVSLYWSENLILGAITLVKMLHLGRASALGRMLFFSIHYGIFCAAHGLFIVELFPRPEAEIAVEVAAMSGLSGLFAEPIVQIFGNAPRLWLWAFLALCASHLTSLVLNYFGSREFSAATVNGLMSAPYSRIMVLHVTVLLGGLAIEALGAPIYLLIVLVIVKLLVDLVLHNREHRQVNGGE